MDGHMSDYIVAEFDRHKLCNMPLSKPFKIYSPGEVEHLKQTSIVEIDKLNSCGYDLQPDETAREAQITTLAGYLCMSIDNYMFMGQLNRQIVNSKVKNLGSLMHLGDKGMPDLSGSDIDVMHKIKTASIAELRNGQPYEMHSLQQTQDYPFLDYLAELIKPDHVFLYGSSANGDGQDYDLMIFVPEHDRKLYDIIWSKRDEVPADKEVGIVMMPTDKLVEYACSDYHSRLIGIDGKLVFEGCMDFPVVDVQSAIDLAYIKTGKELSTLRSAVGNDDMLKRLTSIPKYRYSMQKLEIWIRKALKQREVGRYLSKEEFLDMEDVPLRRWDHQPTKEEVRLAFIDANIRVKERIEDHVP
jgi:hypothetical protein